MTTDPIHVMAETLSTVLEEMAFTFVDPSEGQVPTPTSGDILQATISFTGPVSGTLTLAASSTLCAELGANLLGLEPSDFKDRENIADTLGELLNVTCGNFTTTMFGAEPLFDQTIPEIRAILAAEWEALRQRPEALTLMVDDRPLVLHADVRES